MNLTLGREVSTWILTLAMSVAPFGQHQAPLVAAEVELRRRVRLSWTPESGRAPSGQRGAVCALPQRAGLGGSWENGK